MALRDAVRTHAGARTFATGLYAFLHGRGDDATCFARWCETVARLSRRQTRVLTWPVVTVVGFIAQPDRYIFLKPTVMRRAAEARSFELAYRSRPNWETYRSVLAVAARIRRGLRDFRPRDMIDLQSFMWVQGSDGYD